MAMTSPFHQLRAGMTAWFFLLLVLSSPLAGNPDPGLQTKAAATLPLFKQACRAQPDRHAFAVQQGAGFVVTPDQKSFAVVWFPPGVDPAATPVIATLHGHGSWALDEFFLWQPFAKKHGFGVIALQWWSGQGEDLADYLQPHEISRSFDQLFRRFGLKPGRHLFHGFSRGSANTYGVTVFDRTRGRKLFLLTIANAGKASPGFPINRKISQGEFGPQPFSGSHWIMYAGQNDPNPDRDGIPGMRETESWVKRLGGTVDLFIADPNGGHGGFHRNPKHVEAALKVFERLLSEQRRD